MNLYISKPVLIQSIFHWRWSYKAGFFQYGIEFFRRYFLREVNCQGLQEGLLLLLLRLELNRFQTPQSNAGKWLWRLCALCLAEARGWVWLLLVIPGLQCSLCVHRAWGIIHHLWDLCLPFPSWILVILGAAGLEEQRPKWALPARMDSPLGNPWRALWKFHQWKVIACSFVGHFVRVLIQCRLRW